MSDCKHDRVEHEIVDQTLGVMCSDCGDSLGYCWGDDHCSEYNWNRVADVDPGAKRCEQNRHNFCFLCGSEFVPEPAPADQEGATT